MKYILVLILALPIVASATEVSIFAGANHLSPDGAANSADYLTRQAGLNVALSPGFHIGGSYGDEASRDEGLQKIDTITQGYMRFGQTTGTGVFIYAGATYTDIDLEGSTRDDVGWSIGVSATAGRLYFAGEYVRPLDGIDGITINTGLSF
ncbi:MAG: hypothetical protein HKO06_06690 [Pseudomonadales bacterium]|nr:hypothetical protein [Pseudomonadales bacterium]